MSEQTKNRAKRASKAKRRPMIDPIFGKLLPDDACPTCGTIMAKRRGRLSVSVNGESISVPGVAHLKCPKCGEVMFDLKAGVRMEEDAIEIYRSTHHLLSADEIRALREKFNLTQADLAALLQLGANTISRWESGRNVQSAAMDKLLRIIRDLPGTIEYLRSTAA